MNLKRRRTLRGTVAAASAATAAFGALALAQPAQAAQAAVFTGPPVQLVPQHVPQLPPGQGQLVLTADGTQVGNQVRQQVDLGLRTQKWRFRFIGGSVAQIVNDASGLCMRGALTGNTVRLAVCADPNNLNPTVPEQRQFWRDRQTLLNGVIVHRLESVQNGLRMGIRDSSQAAGGILDCQPINGQPNQSFRLRSA